MIQPPTTPEDYIGYNAEDILFYIRKTYTGTSHRRFFILHGPPGCGKTTLVNVIKNVENLTMRYSNASDARRVSDIKENDYLTAGLDANRVFVVLDECDAVTKGAWEKIEEMSKLNNKIPIILISNTLSKIPEKIRKNSVEKSVTINRFSLKAFAKRINEQENLNLTDAKIDGIVDKCNSYRGVITLLEYGYNDEIEVNLSQREQILSAMNGEYVEFKTTDLRTVITIYHDNVSTANEIISKADIFLGRYENGYPYGKHIVCACLNAIRAKKDKLEYPRTYTLIYNARNKKEGIEPKRQKRKMPDISIVGLK